MSRALSHREFQQELIKSRQTVRDLKTSIGRRLTIAQLLDRVVRRHVNVNNAELTAAWSNLNDEEKISAELVHARQIVVRTQEEGTRVLRALKRGGDFAELAKRHSLGPEGTQGGDLGWFEKGIMPPVFDEICFSLKPGELSGLMPSEYGFHIFHVMDVEPVRNLSFEEMRSRLESKILHAKLQAAETRFLDGLKSRYTIKRNFDVLDTVE